MAEKIIAFGSGYILAFISGIALADTIIDVILKVIVAALVGFVGGYAGLVGKDYYEKRKANRNGGN